MKNMAFKPPVKAIRVVSCGNDWASVRDATRTADNIRGLSLDSWGVHLYTKDRDIHGEYDNVNVPYSNLEALIFYFDKKDGE